MSHVSFYELDSRSKALKLNWLEDVRLKMTLADLDRCRHCVQVASDLEQRRIERRFDRMLTTTRRRTPLATMTSPPLAEADGQSFVGGRNSKVRSASAGTVRSTVSVTFTTGKGETNLVFKASERSADMNINGDKYSLESRMAPPVVGFRCASGTRRCRSCLPREMSLDEVNELTFKPCSFI
jgi:hypothetical protein